MFPSHEVVNATLAMRDWYRKFVDRHARLPKDDEIRARVQDQWPYFKDSEKGYIYLHCATGGMISKFTEAQTGWWGPR